MAYVNEIIKDIYEIKNKDKHFTFSVKINEKLSKIEIKLYIIYSY